MFARVLVTTVMPQASSPEPRIAGGTEIRQHRGRGAGDAGDGVVTPDGEESSCPTLIPAVEATVIVVPPPAARTVAAVVGMVATVPVAASPTVAVAPPPPAEEVLASSVVRPACKLVSVAAVVAPDGHGLRGGNSR